MKIAAEKNIVKLILQLTVLLLLIQFPGLAQKNYTRQNINVLIHDLESSSGDTGKIKLLNEFAGIFLGESELSKSNGKQVIDYLRRAVSLNDSLQLGLSNWKYRSLCLLGYAFIRSDSEAAGKKIFMDLVTATQKTGDRNREAESWYKYGRYLSAADKDERTIEHAYVNAAKIYHDIKNIKLEIEVGLEIAYLHSQNNKERLAEKEYLTLVSLSEKNANYKLGDIYFLLSILNRYEGNFNIALKYALQSVNYIKDSSLAHNYYGELAEVYQALNKPAESITWYKKCILQREAGDFYGLILYRTYGLLAIQLIKAAQAQEALILIKDLVKRKPPKHADEKAAVAQSMAYCNEAIGEDNEAEKYFLAALGGYQKAAVSSEIIDLAIYDISAFYILHRQFKKADFYLAMLSAHPSNIITQKNIALLRFKVDSVFGRYISSIRHFQEYKSLTDSIVNEAKNKQIEELQIQYHTEKKDQDIKLKDQSIELLTKKGQLQQSILRQTTTMRNLVLGGAVMLSLLLGLGYNRYRLKQKSNHQLEQQQLVINQKNLSLQHLVDEKEWLVKEIHHRVKNNFHIVMGLLGTQAGYLKNEEAIVAMTESQHRIHAMSLIHQKLYQSENLSAINMPEYIHELVEYLKDSFDLKQRINFEVQVEKLTLDLSHTIPLGLILNEAITNAIKYAFPGNKGGLVNISFRQVGDNCLLLTVTDNGIGISPGFDFQKTNSMGMNLMHGLSEDIGGIFTIENNGGTQVTISFTYEPESFAMMPPLTSNKI